MREPMGLPVRGAKLPSVLIVPPIGNSLHWRRYKRWGTAPIPSAAKSRFEQHFSGAQVISASVLINDGMFLHQRRSLAPGKFDDQQRPYE